MEKEAQKAGLNKKEVLTLASLIEREAKHNEDRAIVAGILIKRGENDWPLQIDATVQYVLGRERNWWPQVTKRDLNTNSPYNRKSITIYFNISTLILSYKPISVTYR